ncbi:hypothetical protein CVT26_005271 [Gymnopilus dilepis]|uniref:Uncharacterized protein n=1 Tax=Gymnopilus dilepis TaxID=231916 RepID=A0A409YVP0_9AGAR|nr:hypothetical protein CVT26_005271 [Gymnopilus dilepis]
MIHNDFRRGLNDFQASPERFWSPFEADKPFRGGRQACPLLITVVDEDGPDPNTTSALRAYALHHPSPSPSPDQESVEDANKWKLPLLTAVRHIHLPRCLASIGRTAVTGGADGTVRVWDVITGQCRLVLIGHRDAVTKVGLDETNTIYSISRDLDVRVWDGCKGDCLRILEVSVDTWVNLDLLVALPHLVTPIYFHQHKTYTISIWDPASSKVIGQINDAAWYSLGPAPRVDRTLVTIVHEGFKIWDIGSGRLLGDYSVRSDPQDDWWNRVSCSQGRFIIAIARNRSSIDVYDFGLDEGSAASGGMTGDGRAGLAVPVKKSRKRFLEEDQNASSSRSAGGEVSGSLTMQDQRSQEDAGTRTKLRRVEILR